MSKGTVTRVFLGSVVAVIAGMVLAIAAVWVAFANGAFVMDGPNVVGVQATPAAWTIIGLGLVAALAMMAGFIGGLAAWIGALLDTGRYEDKTWFILVLVLGLFSFGLVAMIAYVIAAPDGENKVAPRATHVPV